MIIYNKNISKHKLSFSPNKQLSAKLKLKKSLPHKNLTQANKEFLKSLNFKLRKP